MRFEFSKLYDIKTSGTWKMLKLILSWQSEFKKFLQAHPLARSNIPHFSTKKICDHIENGKLLKEKFGHV